MFLRSLSLSKKLFAALLLPVALIIGFLGLRIADAVETRDAAQEQLAEENRFQAVSTLVNAVNVEDRAYFAITMEAFDIPTARADVDAALDAVLDPELGVDTPTLQRIVDLHAELLAAREVIGDGGTSVATRAQIELIEGVDPLSPGSVIFALGVPSRVATEIAEAYTVDASALAGAEEAALVTSFQLVQELRADYNSESSFIIGATSLPPEAVTPLIVQGISQGVAGTDSTLTSLRTLATPETSAAVEAILSSDTYGLYSEDRAGAQTAQAGVAIPGISLVELASNAEYIDGELTAVGEGLIATLEAAAEGDVEAAERQLLESIVLGALVLLIMGAVLVGLYLSIRNPLRKLTTRSTEIAEVELPEVVRTMRTGDGVAPEITELSSPTTDEVGELTDAFNGMYRTAIELAAEQAASRRVVADMFVNLGRRNQKLLNRMLKGLGQLEQEEQDPDTLGALYKVDQLATRMRRNAESLLILAGAGQSRTFNRDVSLYEVIQSALSEVEDFQRVDVVVDSELQMDGHYVADVAHLLAELIENALLFSPPSTSVEVITRETSKGLVVAVADSGVGMPQDSLDAANERIRSAAEQTETPSEFLGHYVVGRLADRHGVEVKLVQGAASGTVARVVLPAKMFGEDNDINSLDDLGQVAELSPGSPFADQRTSTLPEVEALPELESVPSNDEQFAPVAEFDGGEAPVAAADPSDSPFGDLRRGGPVDADSSAPVAEFDGAENSVVENSVADASASPFGNLRRGGPVDADAPSVAPLGDPLLTPAADLADEVEIDEFAQRDSLDAFTAGVRLADEVEADDVEAAETEVDDIGDDVPQHDSLGAFTAGVRLAEEGDDAFDADDTPVAMLDWAQVDSDLMLDGDAPEFEELDAVAELDEVDEHADAATEAEVTFEIEETLATVELDDVPHPVVPETGDVLEVTSDFGSPAGERIPLPQVDARRPLYEPSVDFGEVPQPPAEPAAHSDIDDVDADHSELDEDQVDAVDVDSDDADHADADHVGADHVDIDDADHADATHVDVDHVEEAPEFAMSAATASPDVDAETEIASPFTAVRRDPGASLPVRQRLSPAASTTTTSSDSEEAEHTTPDDIRSSLSGFQTGVVRAEKETH